MLRKPMFWVLFVLSSLLGTAWAVRHFADAFPLISLDLRMDRSTALGAAEALAVERGWGPDRARQAARFVLDSEVQSFVELEAGGREAFAALLAGELNSPYTWVVRRFREGETNEVAVSFRPDGRAYGFRETVPEDEPGASLEPEAARALAEAAVASGWQVRLDEFELVEASRELRPGGRTDHSLVYERPDERLGEGRYRLRLTVSGDRLTELSHFVKIPEAFSRRYQEMRAANEGIASGSLFATVILYLGGGCAFGLFFLLRERWLLWKPAVMWGLLIAGLQGLMSLNEWPLQWMSYDTAVSTSTFALQQIALAIGQVVALGAILSLVFMAAEGLGRRAFPSHLQLWRTWSGRVAPTRTVLGQTLAGYLLVGIFFAYEVWLYVFAARNLGWWSPSSALTDPDVLATYLPWLSSIGISLQAGFMEECLFRAVPLAAAALLGRRFGKTWLWIAGAMLLQAVVFGAGHANYPAQPAYARLAELIVPALGFGGIYLAFGLLPAIVLHFAFDVVWFAMPLFAAATPGIWVSRALVVLLTLVPLWVVLAARWRAGSWFAIPEDARNAAWAPPPAAPRAAAPTIAASRGLPKGLRIALPLAGVAGLVLWALTTGFRPDAPPIEGSDAEARAASRAHLSGRGVELGPEWRELSSVEAPVGLQDRFVWSEGGPEAYRELLGHYLPLPRRLVRYARFEGDVAERAEEYLVLIGPDGAVQRLTHTLPEGRAGAQLEEGAARAIALASVLAEHGLEAEAIVEVSADPSQLPARRDWSFVFRDTASYPLAAGEARIAIQIAGDEVVERGRFVHIPEDWERAQRRRQGVTRVVQIACSVTLVLLFAAGAVLAVVRWSRGRFASATFGIFFALMAVLGAVQLGNGFRPITSQFDTAQPWKLQVAIVLVGGLIAVTAVAAVSALLIGLAHRWLPPQLAADRRSGVAAGLGLGAVISGLGAAAAALAPATMPDWPSFAGAADWSPAVTAATGPLESWLMGTALMLAVVAAVTAFTEGWRRRRTAASALLLALGLVVAGSDGVESLPRWLAEGLLIGLVLLAAWVVVLRHRPALVPLATGAGAILGALRQAVVAPFPGAAGGAFAGAVLVLAAAVWWVTRIGFDTVSRPGPGTDVPAADAAALKEV